MQFKTHRFTNLSVLKLAAKHFTAQKPGFDLERFAYLEQQAADRKTSADEDIESLPPILSQATAKTADNNQATQHLEEFKAKVTDD
jgi:hypothetical protein